MDKHKIIDLLTELRDIARQYNWVKPQGGLQSRLIRALDVADHLLSEIEKEKGV